MQALPSRTALFRTPSVPYSEHVVASRVRDIGQALRYTTARPPHFLVVLGMHRSGTSVVSRILSLMGSNVGPVLREQAAIDDDEQHWEGSTLPWINEQILRRSGGGWDTPPARIVVSRRDVWRARRFLWQFAGAEIASFKDPRACLTYPLWWRVLPPHSIIACVRHPMNVAQSLAKREGWPLDRGLELWLAYNTKLVAYLAAAPLVHWFNFDDGFDAAQRLIDTLGRRYGLNGREEAIQHYRPENHHHTSRHTALPEDVQSLYNWLLKMSAGA